MADGITVTVDTGPYFARLQAILGDMSEPNEAVGQELLGRMQQSFEAQSSPGGEPWPPLAPSTMRQFRREGREQMLRRTGKLYSSLGYEVTAEGVAIGTGPGVDYAIYVHEGTSKMPPRRFVFDGNFENPVLPDPWMNAINEIYGDFLDRAGER